MGILIADNFNYQGRKPLDNRVMQNTIADMVALAEPTLHDGLIVYVKDEKKFYVYDSSNTVDATLNKWREFTSGGSGNASIEEYIQNKNYKKDTLVYYNNLLARVILDYTSDDTQTTVEESFKLDELNKNLILVNSDIDIKIRSKKYLDTTISKQTVINFTDLFTTLTINDLKENQIIYDDAGTVAIIDSINTTTNEIEITTITAIDATDFILEYYRYKKVLDKEINKTQLILFSDLDTTINILDLMKNQIVFDLEGTLAKIETIDDVNLELTVRIIEIDTKVTPIKSYKTTEILNTAINSQQLINLPTGINTSDIEVEQLVYDDYGTLSKILSIDDINNQLTVQIITGLGMPIAPNHKEPKIKNGGLGYANGDVIEANNVSGVFIKVTKVDNNGTILEVLVDETATSSSTLNGKDAEINYDQVIYGGYGNNWYQLSDAAVMVAQTIAESFEFLQGYDYEITAAGTNYVVGDILEIDTNMLIKVTEIGTSGEIVSVAYTRETTQNTSGTGATITYSISDNVFIIPGDRWNIGTAMFTLTNDDGATVQFLRTEQNLVKFSMGEYGLYKFTFDNVDGIIYQEFSKISGSGGATLSEEVTSNVDVGNIKVNDLFKTGTTFTDFVKKLLIKEILPTGKITSTKSGMNLKGTTVTTPRITATILNNGTCTIDKIEFYRGTSLENTQNYITGTNTYIYDTSDINSNETVSIKIYFTMKDGVTRDSITYSTNYRFINYSYSGILTDIPTDADIVSLNQNLKETNKFTGTFNPVNSYIVYAYPKSFGDLLSIKDQNNFEYISSYTKVTMVINNEDYNVYYRSNKITATGLKQIFS